MNISTLINLRFSTNLAKHVPQPCFGPSQFQPFPHELLTIPLGLASRHGPARIFDDGSLAINPYQRCPSWVNNSAGNSIWINQPDPLRCVCIYTHVYIYTYSFMNQRTFWLDALWWKSIPLTLISNSPKILTINTTKWLEGTEPKGLLGDTGGGKAHKWRSWQGFPLIWFWD